MFLNPKSTSFRGAFFVFGLDFCKIFVPLSNQNDSNMTKTAAIQLFDEKQIRIVWDDEEEKYYFSIVDVVQALTEQPTPRGASTYWAVLKKRLRQEGADELLTNCKQLKLKATDGKMRLTDVADIEQLMRIIQSIPSKKAEPLKRWLAEVGSQRIDQIIDPGRESTNCQRRRRCCPQRKADDGAPAWSQCRNS